MYAATSQHESLTAATSLESTLQRFDGAARVEFSGTLGVSHLTKLYQRPPCRALFPRSDRDVPECVLLNTAGGVTGGDRLRYEVGVDHAGELLVTTQSAERIYRSLGTDGCITTLLTVGNGAQLSWLPQETIMFDGARLKRRTVANVEGNGRLLAMDWLVLGRTAHGETVERGKIHDRWRVYRDGRLIWADDFRLMEPISELVRRPALLDGAIAMAIVIVVAPDAHASLERARGLLAACRGRTGATAFDGVLLCRFFADCGQSVRADVSRFLLGMPGAFAALPRVWAC